MKLIVHIGPYKTGSSAIQKALSVATLRNIEYCKINSKNANEIPLLVYQRRKSTLIHILEKAIKRAKSSNKSTVLLSAESLWGPDEFYRLHGIESNIHFERTFIELCLTRFEKLEVIMVDRVPLEVSRSVYRQVVRDVSSYDENWQSFRLDFNDVFDYDKIKKRWRHPGVSKFHVIKYNREVLLQEFGQLLNEQLDDSIEENVSLHLKSDTVKYLMNNRNQKKLIRIIKWRAIIELKPVYILDLVKWRSLLVIFRVIIKETMHFIYKQLK